MGVKVNLMVKQRLKSLRGSLHSDGPFEPLSLRLLVNNSRIKGARTYKQKLSVS